MEIVATPAMALTTRGTKLSKLEEEGEEEGEDEEGEVSEDKPEEDEYSVRIVSPTSTTSLLEDISSLLCTDRPEVAIF